MAERPRWLLLLYCEIWQICWKTVELQMQCEVIYEVPDARAGVGVLLAGSCSGQHQMQALREPRAS